MRTLPIFDDDKTDISDDDMTIFRQRRRRGGGGRRRLSPLRRQCYSYRGTYSRTTILMLIVILLLLLSSLTWKNSFYHYYYHHYSTTRWRGGLIVTNSETIIEPIVVNTTTITKTTPNCHYVLSNNNSSSNNNTIITTTKTKGLAIIAALNHERDIFKSSKVPVNATFEYIASWYESVQSFRDDGMQGIVLHNMFTNEQTKAWQTSEINFVRVHNHTPSFQQARRNRRPINDLRFYILHELLQRWQQDGNNRRWRSRSGSSGRTNNNNNSNNSTILQPPPSSSLDFVLFTDAYDVRFLRNPFEYMQQMDTLLSQPQIYIGEEYDYNVRKTIWDKWMNKSSVQCFHGKVLPPSSRMINCGIVGGQISMMIPLLQQWVQLLQTTPPHKVCDQISLYYLLKKHYQDKYISGYPFNAMFNQWETSNDTVAYIAHK